MMTSYLALAVVLSAAFTVLAARGASPAALDRGCIPAGCVAPSSDISDTLSRRALPAGRFAGLRATPDLRHGLPAQAPVTPTADDVASALQRKYDAVRDFSADFTHQHEGGVLRRKLIERGTVLVKKPGKMRWHYQTPEEKLFVSDGKRMYFHDPANNQVTITEMPEGDQAATAALFLTGRGNLTRDFAVSFLPGAGPDVHGLKLDPKQPQSEYDWLEVVVYGATLQIRSLTAADQQGTRSTFLFSNFKENVGLADKMFAFSPPRGAEIIHAGRPKR